MQDINEINLAYLLLSQRLIRIDINEAAYRLGISRESAKIIVGLTTTQVMKLASNGAMRCELRLDSPMMLGSLTLNNQHNLQHAHSAILLAQQQLKAT